MSLKVISEQVLKFISQSSPSVMAIKGEWGVGKTFGWEALLSEASKEKMVSGKRYSYVSLFGISSMDKLKSAIFENSIPKEYIGCEPSLDSLINNTFGMLETLGRGSLGKLRDIPLIKSAAPVIESFSFMSITDSLICIDDLERKGTALELKDVLGLVSLLKEKRKCKVVLLLNSGTEEASDYERYKEKVIDIELEFSPTPEESAKLAYDKSKSYHSELSNLTVSLGIKNIRVLAKIEKNIETVINFLDKSESELVSQLLQSVALFSWAYYCSIYDDNIPTLDFIESLDSVIYIDSESEGDKEKFWKDLLLSYNFTGADDFDKMIAKLVRSGYVDRDGFISVALVLNEKIIADKKSDSYQKAWEFFHNSFNDNKELVVSKLCDGFFHNVHQLLPGDLDSLVELLRDLDEDEKASGLIDYFIKERKDVLSFFNPDNFNFIRKIEDVEILNKFKKIYRIEITKESIKDVLTRISGRDTWGSNDENVLSEATEDEYYNYFKAMDGTHLASHVSTCLKFGRFNNGSERLKLISEKARSALSRIAAESKLNEIRMKKFRL